MKIGIKKSFTKNLGNYESAKVEYWLEKEVPDEQEDFTRQELSLKIDDYLEKELAELAEEN